MSNATVQVICKVDENCIKPKVPSDQIYFKVYKKTCTQSVVTPPSDHPASIGTDQVLSAVTYAGCPFNSCCYKDSDIKWDLYYIDDAGEEVKICRIHFHQPWSTSWHLSETTYYDPDNGKYDVMIKTVDDVTKSLKCELHVRPKA
jgi:hypothetical protein